jgi:hypothetical protein
MSLSDLLSAPFYTGAATAEGTRFDVYLGGHGYMIDTKFMDDFGWQTVPAIRQQADSAERPNEGTLNPESAWRRAIDSWHLGAGQDWYDKPDSSPYRFRSSKGIDPWTKYALTLHHDTLLERSSSENNLYLASAGGRLYTSDGNEVWATGVGTTSFVATTGLTANPVTSLASDGTNLYVASAGGLYSTAGGTAFTSYATGAPTLVRYVRGRLIVAVGKAVYNVTASGGAITAGTVLLDHPNAGWTWTDAAEGARYIYLAGYAGDKSLIYRSSIKEDGTGLDVAVPAAELPDGEVARSITGYLGYMVIGTDKGVRFAVADNDGGLTLGSLIRTTSPVLCAEGQDRFVWFGLTNYDSTSTGLGRLDLQNFAADLTPAWASDLMGTAQGDVQSVVTYLGDRWFTVAGIGAFAEQDTSVASGELVTGRITYGIPDDKTVVNAEIIHDPLPSTAEVTLSLSTDGAAAAVLGTSELDGSAVSTRDTFSVQERGTYHEVTVTLVGAVTVRRLTLFAEPNPERTVLFTVPLLLFHSVDVDGTQTAVDVLTERTYLQGLADSGEIINYVESGFQMTVKVQDFAWRPHNRAERGWSGTFIARLKEVSS